MEQEPLASSGGRKLCAACGLEKPRIEFNRDARRRDGLFPYCKECRTEFRRTKYREDKDYSHARAVKKNYGLSSEEYRAIFESQGGCCAICGRHASNTSGKGNRLQVDHCHETGKIRGFLCDGCNRGLGSFGDDPERIKRADEYLRKWGSDSTSENSTYRKPKVTTD